MKIAIIGSRGIPNNYGGFEQLAEYLSALLSEMGHDITVYNSSLHPYKLSKWGKVNIVHCYDPEDKLGTSGQFIYDLNCIINSRKQNFDIILQLGYTSSSIWSFLFPKGAKLITNMDGMEWKRSKYGTLTKQFLKRAEKWAIKYSDALIADSIGIQEYLLKEYNVTSTYIAYGANVIEEKNESILNQYQLTPFNYYLVIARLEPENSIETIIKGFLLAESKLPLIIIGSTNTPFGIYLKQTYTDSRIQFKEAVYDIAILNQLRFYSKLYFHGHSVGGTNPSLLEAMAAGALLCVHQNIFNKSIVEEGGFYFSNEQDIATLLTNENFDTKRKLLIKQNILKIKKKFSWKKIASAYHHLFSKHAAH